MIPATFPRQFNSWWSPMPKNVQKPRGRPTRSIAKRGDHRESGLWIDYDLLRKRHGHSADAVYDSSATMDNRYLELADIALGNKKIKKK